MIIRAVVVLSFGAFLIQMPNSWAKKFAVALSPQPQQDATCIPNYTQ